MIDVEYRLATKVYGVAELDKSIRFEKTVNVDDDKYGEVTMLSKLRKPFKSMISYIDLRFLGKVEYRNCSYVAELMKVYQKLTEQG